MRYKFSINKHGPAHSDLRAPWREPEVGEVIARVADLGKQAESSLHILSTNKEKKIIVSNCLSLVQVFMNNTQLYK